MCIDSTRPCGVTVTPVLSFEGSLEVSISSLHTPGTLETLKITQPVQPKREDHRVPVVVWCCFHFRYSLLMPSVSHIRNFSFYLPFQRTKLWVVWSSIFVFFLNYFLLLFFISIIPFFLLSWGLICCSSLIFWYGFLHNSFFKYSSLYMHLKS